MDESNQIRIFRENQNLIDFQQNLFEICYLDLNYHALPALSESYFKFLENSKFNCFLKFLLFEGFYEMGAFFALEYNLGDFFKFFSLFLLSEKKNFDSENKNNCIIIKDKKDVLFDFQIDHILNRIILQSNDLVMKLILMNPILFSKTQLIKDQSYLEGFPKILNDLRKKTTKEKIY